MSASLEAGYGLVENLMNGGQSNDQHGAQETHTLKAPSARNVPSEASAHSETIGAKITDQLCLPHDLVSTA